MLFGRVGRVLGLKQSTPQVSGLECHLDWVEMGNRHSSPKPHADWDQNIFSVPIPNFHQNEMRISHDFQSTDHLSYKTDTISNSVSESKDNAHSSSFIFLTRSFIFHIRQIVCAFEKCEKCEMRLRILTYSQFPLQETDLVSFPNL